MKKLSDSIEMNLLLLYLMKDKPLKINTNFWACLGLITDTIKIHNISHDLNKESCFKEMEECFMEEELQNPTTHEEWMFWLWNTTDQHEHSTFFGYDEFWDLRHIMMQYHYNKAKSEKND